MVGGERIFLSNEGLHFCKGTWVWFVGNGFFFLIEGYIFVLPGQQRWPTLQSSKLVLQTKKRMRMLAEFSLLVDLRDQKDL